MTNPEAIVQLARLVGRAELARALGLAAGNLPASLDAEQLRRLHALVDTRLDAAGRGLLEEAMASDDVQDTAAALAFLDDRLGFLGDLLTPPQQQRLRQQFSREAESWGSPSR